MLLIVRQFFHHLPHIHKYGDPRAEEYLIMQSFYYPILIVGAYMMFVLKIGPNFMKNRNPFNLSTFVMGYNLFQIAVNCYLVYKATAILPQVSPTCNAIAPSDYSYRAKYFINLHYIYLMIKILDFMDTIIMVLRKKTRQISFLHVYHHVLMVTLAWILLKYVPAGQSYHLGYINSVVHVVMYIYYFLTAWNPSLSQNLWWKKYITQFQIVQHCFITVSYSVALFNPNCSYSKLVSNFGLTQALFFIVLFSHFYYKSYVEKNLTQK